jgi:alginate O-acetyltransferase complex protein AlgI
MPINSFPFVLAFLPAVIVVLAILRRFGTQRQAAVCLLIASVVYYAFNGVADLPLLLGSIVFNWFIARTMVLRATEKGRKSVLVLGLTINTALLCCVKYIPFLLGSISALHGPQIAAPHWGLPLGISFFTLTQVMYLVDTYQGLNAANSLLDHATLVSFFPYITAGPIVRSRAIVPQFAKARFDETLRERGCRGLYLFSLGLIKKVVLADSFGVVADAGFGSMRTLSMLEAWVFVFAYTFQLYFDFSGYSDMALGVAWMVGIDIPQNFNAPYRSFSMSEFWQRWHISLSGFITSYLYTPILRSMGKARLATSMVAVIAAMGIAGLWHGAAWTYVAFGLLHGIALATNQLWKKRRLPMPGWLGWILTFIFVSITFCVFRSPSLSFALHMVKLMLPHSSVAGVEALKKVGIGRVRMLPLVVGVVVAFAFGTSSELAAAFRPTRTAALVTAALLVV